MRHLVPASPKFDDKSLLVLTLLAEIKLSPQEVQNHVLKDVNAHVFLRDLEGLELSVAECLLGYNRDTQIQKIANNFVRGVKDANQRK